jgi:mannosyltransferase OCH1-like enzyme
MDKNMIPKKIYQTYRENLPEFAIDNIKNMNQDYEYEFFNDNDCIKFIEKKLRKKRN